ncbi:MAG: class I adenylate cyclase [Alteromonadaceae bacterium]|nr:class I adenylate cyclase [Alteromonadaceae bacterium]
MSSQQPRTVKQNLTIRLLRVLRYNKARIERALVLLPEEHRPLFHVLPFLLHINHPDLPGFVEAKGDACFGLNNYSLREEVKQAISAIFPEQIALLEDLKAIWPRQRAIDALVLMGSVGTIAQSDKSDFDYWVCVDGNKLTPASMQKMQDKLSAIEQWAQNNFDIEVHFFLSDIDKVKNNDFGVAEGESAGSAQAVFLKAEFYTTNIVVAGKAPFWWLTPDSTTEKQYYALLNQLEAGGSPDLDWFMDLGHLEKLDVNELFGAAIWQLGKAMDSPFKSVLKMAKLEVFLDNLEHEQPLCNLLKQHVHHGDEAPGNVANIDPYALMFDQLIAHYESARQPDVVSLLQQCLYIKCGCKLSQPVEENEVNFKRLIIAGYVKRWGWNRSQLRHLDNADNWTFSELVQLSRRIHRFLIQCYRRMSAQLKMGRQSVSKEDMTVLGRRLEAYYAKKEHKLDFLRIGFDDKVNCPVITVKQHKLKNGQPVWAAYDGNLLGKQGKAQDKSRVYVAESPVGLMLWCVCNRVVNTDTKVLLDYDTEPVVENDLKSLIKHFTDIFPPVRVNAVPRQNLLEPAYIKACLVVANFTTMRIKQTVEEITVVYSTSWGETFLVPGKEAIDNLWFELQEVFPRPPCYVFVPDGMQRKRIYQAFVDTTEYDFELLNYW